MDESTEPEQPRTVPVDPRIHVETFATHCTVTWKANGLVPFIETVRDIDSGPVPAAVVTDSPDVAGRQQHELETFDAESTTATYAQVQPSAPWTLSWERRTWPVVSVSGTPSPELCRDIHQGTTDCSGWDDDALARLARMTAPVR